MAYISYNINDTIIQRNGKYTRVCVYVYIYSHDVMIDEIHMIKDYILEKIQNIEILHSFLPDFHIPINPGVWIKY